MVPSNPRDAKELLIAAIEDPDPVIFLEPQWLYNGPFDGHHESRRLNWFDPYSLFDLTAAGARVARALASGKVVDSISAGDGTSATTVRTDVRGVLGKTGCHRQPDLVALLNGTWSPPARGWRLARKRHNRRRLDGLRAAMVRGQAFKGRQFAAEVILWAARQDHRRVKRLTRPGLGFGGFWTA